MPGDGLSRDEWLVSPNGLFALVIHQEPYLVLWAKWGEPLWWIEGVNEAHMHRDGRFAAYDRDGKTVWESGTIGHDGAWLSLRDDGNLVVNEPDGSGTLWQSKTALDLSVPEKELVRRIVDWKSEGRDPYGGVYGFADRIYKVTWKYDSLAHEVEFASPSKVSRTQVELSTVNLENCTEVAIPRTWADTRETEDIGVNP